MATNSDVFDRFESDEDMEVLLEAQHDAPGSARGRRGGRRGRGAERGAERSRGAGRGRRGRGAERSRGAGRGRRGRGAERGAERSRGTSRGRRGAGRSRGRGQQTRAGVPSQSESGLPTKLAERKTNLKKIIHEAGQEKLQALALRMVELNPGLMTELLQESGSSSPASPQPTGSHSPPPWCKCTRCTEMPTEAEKVCCKKAPHHCLSILPDFEALVLDESVLSLARAQRRDALVLEEAEEGDINKAQRYAAYRQFILWKYGYLGEGVRISIYSCCVCAIRKKFPDPTGQYTGFHAGRLC